MISILNIGFPSDIRDAIGESTNSLQALCESAEINKWGLHRKYISGVHSIARLTAMNDTPFSGGHWRGYYNGQDRPGVWSAALPGVSKDRRSFDFDILSLGAWTLTRQEYISGAWVNIDDSADSWFIVPKGSFTWKGGSIGPGPSANHDIAYNTTSWMVTGSSAPSDTIHALSSYMRLWIDENTGAERTGRLVLSHPDEEDADLPANNEYYEFTQGTGGLMFDDSDIIVSGSQSEYPSYHNVYFGIPSPPHEVRFDTGPGSISWIRLGVNDGGFKSRGSPVYYFDPLVGSGYLNIEIASFWSTVPATREAYISCDLWDNVSPYGSLVDSVTIGITQHAFIPKGGGMEEPT